MMKLNQSGEDKESLEQHLREHEKLLEYLGTVEKQTADGKEYLANRIKSVQDIIKARRTALSFLCDNNIDTVSSHIGVYRTDDHFDNMLENNHFS